jgi:dolichol-phosphate mannosyltransferase
VLADRYGLRLQIVAVNDGSKDRTKEIAERLEKEHDNFKLINHPHNKGLGEAVKTGLLYFTEECPDSTHMCLMDCDNTQDPVYITDMLDRMNEKSADVVIASRYQSGAEVKGVSGIRLLMSGGAKYVFSVLLHVPGVRDYTCGYRLYGREILKKAGGRFGEGLVAESGFTCMVELLYKLYCCGAVFTEIPFELRYDYKKGSSKMAVLRTAVNSLRLSLELKRIKRS